MSDKNAAVNLIGSLHSNIIYNFNNPINTYISNTLLALVILKS